MKPNRRQRRAETKKAEGPVEVPQPSSGNGNESKPLWLERHKTRIELLLVLAGLTLTLYVGTVQIHIGQTQAKISERQAKLTEAQTEISRSLAELPFNISIEVTYDLAGARYILGNKGQTNLHIWGFKDGGAQPIIYEAGVLTPPGGSSYFIGIGDSKFFEERYPTDGRFFVPVEIYLTNQQEKKFVATCTVTIVMKIHQPVIHVVTNSIRPKNW